MKTYPFKTSGYLLAASLLLITACEKALMNNTDTSATSFSSAPIVLVIDEESIDNGNPPNNFSETEVNDQLATVGLRQPLRYFQNNVGREIELFTGEVGDEGWHAIKTIPGSWINAGPSGNGTRNFLEAGPGLGRNGTEDLLDKIPDLTPLRATGLKMLIGQTIIAVVFDSDVAINYSPLNGSLKGANLGLVALEVKEVRRRTDGSTGSLPVVKVKILDVSVVASAALKLFANVPVPSSSSEPFDVSPLASVPAVATIDAK
jgi:hypothetical protein